LNAVVSKLPRPLASIYETGAKSALKFAAPSAAIGGFVADVLQPIAPVSLYLFILSIICAIVSGMGAWLLRQKIESNMRRRSSLFCSFTTVCSILFGVTWFLFTASCPDKGFLATRIDAIDSIQASLLGVQQSVDRIESTVSQVSTDVGTIKSDVKDISIGVSGLGKMGGIITNPTTPVEFYNNALIYKERGDVASQRKALEAFVKTGEQKIEPFEMLDDVLKGMEGPEGAKKAYENLLRANPDNLMLKTYLFRLLESKVAIDHLQSIIDQNPDFTPAFFDILGGGTGYAGGGSLLDDTAKSLQNLDQVFRNKINQTRLQRAKDGFNRHDVREKIIDETNSQKTDLIKRVSEIYLSYRELSNKRPIRLFLYDSSNGLYHESFDSHWGLIEHTLKYLNESISEATLENK
jgi:tetratricopeptide (TPR) repeat protein